MNEFFITFDIDWVPDFVIDTVALILKKRQVRATWFVTHQSAAIDRLRAEPDLFELGIHPNFLPGSTQGDTPIDVLNYLLSIVPEAISTRSHSIVQSSPLLELIATQTPIRIESNLFLPYMEHIHPLEYTVAGSNLLRVPIFWSDAYEIGKPNPNWDLISYIPIKGYKVILFHPLHVYLNSVNLSSYQKLKQDAPDLSSLNKDIANNYIYSGQGTQTFFNELVDYIATQEKSRCLRDLYFEWKQ